MFNYSGEFKLAIATIIAVYFSEITIKHLDDFTMRFLQYILIGLTIYAAIYKIRKNNKKE